MRLKDGGEEKMAIKDILNFRKRSKSAIGMVIGSADDDICIAGYTSLDKNPEIMAGVKKIAELIGSITIHLMENTADGDVRITNELSRMIDITPMPNMTRMTWVESFVSTMLLHGKGNAIVLPHTRAGYLKRLEPIAAARVAFNPIGWNDYTVNIDGRAYKPDDVLHFVYNPDKTYLWKGSGVTVQLKDIANNLKQAAATKKGFLESKWKPSVIVKVDAMTEQFRTPEGREKILQEYIQMEGEGKPWVVPAEQIDVTTVKPLTLADLAISDSVEIDKKTVAALLGVPPFLLGVGDYDQKAWNNFIQNTIRPIAIGIQQELTRKLILSDKWYLKFNVLSLMDWDLKTISDVFCTLGDRGYVTGNEVRDRIGMSPREGLDELRILENYIPWNMSGLQGKLLQPDGGSDE